MVYVYANISELNKYIGKELSLNEIETILKDLGMDLKGISDDSDPELKIELTAEKMDMISSIGIARAIKYYKLFERKLPNYELIKGENEIIVEESKENPRQKIVGAILRNVPMNQKFLDEMIKIQEKIHDSFGRNRKKAAIGIYPLNKIKFPIFYKSENPEHIVFRPLMSEIEMNGFDILKNHEVGKKYAHLLKESNEFPVLRDSNGNILSMPPIINSFDTGRVDIDDRDLLIEITGNNINHLDNILKVLVTTFIDMGAEAETLLVKYNDDLNYILDLNNRIAEFPFDYIKKLIGIDIDKNELEIYLNKMMYELNYINDNNISVLIPPFRSDVYNDVDIVDDIARAYGYNNIEPKFPSIPSIGEKLKISMFKEQIAENLTRMGFLELYTYMLSSTKFHIENMLLNDYDNKNNNDNDNNNFIKLIDSTDQGINMIRTMILPDNLESLRINRKNKYPQKIFELGWTIQEDLEEETLARNQANLSVSIADPKSNYTEIKEILDTIMKLENIDFEVIESNLPFLISGRQAEIFVKNKKIGFIGELNPEVLSNFDILVPISSFEINIDLLFDLINS